MCNELQCGRLMPAACAAVWDEGKAAKLVAMTEAAIQRRFPKGLKVHVHSVDRFGCLAELTRMLHDAQLTVTRAKARPVLACQGRRCWLIAQAACTQPPAVVGLMQGLGRRHSHRAHYASHDMEDTMLHVVLPEEWCPTCSCHARAQRSTI